MMLRAYRREDEALLSGPWPAGELLGLPPVDRPVLAAITRIEAPTDRSAEVCVAPGAAIVRYSDLDWVHRRARLEIAILPGGGEHIPTVLAAALRHAFDVLNLHRVYGWVTPSAQRCAAALHDAGMRREADVPQALWTGGRAVAREIWGASA